VGHCGESTIRDGNAKRPAVSLGVDSRSLWLIRELMHVLEVVIKAAWIHGQASSLLARALPSGIDSPIPQPSLSLCVCVCVWQRPTTDDGCGCDVTYRTGAVSSEGARVTLRHGPLSSQIPNRGTRWFVSHAALDGLPIKRRTLLRALALIGAPAQRPNFIVVLRSRRRPPGARGRAGFARLLLLLLPFLYPPDYRPLC
jgi:hypothetical protein